MMLNSRLQLFIVFDPYEELRDCLTESLAKVFDAQSDGVGW